MSDENVTKAKSGKAFRRYALLGAFVLCVLALAIGGRLTWSAYTGNAYVKGVEVTNATQSLFASDMLVGYYSDPTAEGSTTQLDARSIVVPTDSDNCSFSFRVYNCLLDDRNVVNDKDVPYTFSVTAAGVTGEWRVDDESGSKTGSGDGTVTFSTITLPGLNATVNTYTITFPKGSLGSASFTVKAAVDTSGSSGASGNIGTKLACLAAKIVPNEASSVQTASVTGAFLNSGSSIENYDAYSYLVTVTGNEAKVELTWNTSCVEIDPHFAINHTGSTIDAASGTATFTLQPGSTIVNFYRVSANEPDNWNNLNISVKKVDEGSSA